MSLLYLVKRNMLLYFKDKASLFFSLLSVLMVLLLMVVFLGDMNSDSLLEALEKIKGVATTTADEQNAEYVVLMWTIAGMLAVNSFTVPLSIIGIYVQDRQYHKLESFYCAPISRMKLLCGYLIAAIINGMIMCTITCLLSFLYVSIQGHPFLDALGWVQVYGMLLVSVSVSAALVLVVSQFVVTSNAWGSFGTIAGTLIGFLGGIYLPMTMLPNAVQNILRSLPFLHQASMLRSVFTQQSVEKIFKGLPSDVVGVYKENMGISVQVFDQTIPPSMQVLLLVGCGIIALSIAVYVLKKRASFDR